MITYSNTPLFAFYLVNELGQSYYIDDAGLLQRSGTPRPIEFSPDGWQEMAIGWERNIAKFGLVRNFSLSLGFFGDGGLILERIYNRSKIDVKIWLLIQRRELDYTDVDYAITYKFYYKGQIDLSTYRKSYHKVLVNIMEGGRARDIKANENTAYIIPLANDPDKIRVKMDGVPITKTALYDVAPIRDKSTGFAGGWQNLATIAISFISEEGSSTGVALLSQQQEQIDGGTSTLEYMAGSDNCIFDNESTFPVDMHIVGKLKVFVVSHTGPGDVFWSADFKRSDDTQFHIFTNVAMNEGDTLEADFDYTITLNPGQKAFLFSFFDNSGSGTRLAQIDFLEVPLWKVNFTTRYKPTFAYAFRAMDAYRRFVEKISGSRDFAKSDLLSGSSLCLTSGDSLRSIPGSFVNCSFNTFTTAWCNIKCAGIGIERDKIVLERRQYFLNDAVVIDLGNISDLQIDPALDFMYNNYKFAYPDQNYDDVNGRYEMNSYEEYQGPIKVISKTLDLQSQVRADPIGMELYRINLDGKNTTDNSSDNDTFFLNVDLDNPQVDDAGTYYNLKRAAYTSVEGFPFPAFLYNIEELTPLRVISEWFSFIRSGHRGYENEKILFTSATKNKQFATFGGPGGDFIECKDMPIGTMPAPFFAPDKLTFKAKYPLALVSIMQATPGACFKGTYLGVELKGYFLKGSVISKTAEEQQFVLLSHPDNDLKLLEANG